MSPPALFLSADDVRAALPAPAELRGLVGEALQSAAAGTPRDDASLHAAWKAGSGALAGRDDLACLTDAAGAPVLVFERAPFLDARGAATTALAATRLADPASEVITLLGCNARGRAVMDALLDAFPDTERMLCWDPDIDQQAAFADEIMTTHSVASIIPPEPRECTEGAHVLVTCLPVVSPPEPFIEPDWLQTGTLCVALDLDTCFRPAVFAAADRRLTDSLQAWRDCASNGHLQGLPEPGEELGAVLTGSAPGRGEGAPIALLVALGHPAVDVALASALLERARAAGRGTEQTV